MTAVADQLRLVLGSPDDRPMIRAAFENYLGMLEATAARDRLRAAQPVEERSTSEPTRHIERRVQVLEARAERMRFLLGQVPGARVAPAGMGS